MFGHVKNISWLQLVTPFRLCRRFSKKIHYEKRAEFTGLCKIDDFQHALARAFSGD